MFAEEKMQDGGWTAETMEHAWAGPCKVCVAVDFMFYFGLGLRALVSICLVRVVKGCLHYFVDPLTPS